MPDPSVQQGVEDLKTHILFAAFFMTTLAQTSFAAFDVSPIILTATPSGPGATVTIQASNDSTSKAPIQISIIHREPDINGKENHEKGRDASDLFQVIPSQVILGPKEKRSIRITYVGEPRITSEQAFRFIAEEFPIDVSDPTKIKNKTVANIAIVSKYIGSIYVKPAGALPQLNFETAVEKNANETRMVLTIKNSGTAHKILQDSKYSFVTGKEKKVIPMSEETVKAIGNHNILAGYARKISFPWPKEVPVGPVSLVADVPSSQKSTD